MRPALGRPPGSLAWDHDGRGRQAVGTSACPVPGRQRRCSWSGAATLIMGNPPCGQRYFASHKLWRTRQLQEAPPGFEPGIEDLQSSALPLGYGANEKGGVAPRRRPSTRCPERETGLEPATPTLARLCSTTELFPRNCTGQDWKPVSNCQGSRARFLLSCIVFRDLCACQEFGIFRDPTGARPTPDGSTSRRRPSRRIRGRCFPGPDPRADY